MKRRTRNRLLVISVLALFLILLTTLFRTPTPTEETRALRKELANLTWWNSQERFEAMKKVRAIGTNALPIVIELLTAEDSLSTKIKMSINGRIGRELFERITPAREKHEQAYRTFEVLGPLAVPAIPILTNLIGRRHCASRAAVALGQIGKEALPALSWALRSKESEVRLQALMAIISLGYREEPELVRRESLFALNDQDPDIHCIALAFLESDHVLATNSVWIIGYSQGYHGSVRETAAELMARIVNFKGEHPLSTLAPR